MRCFVPKVFGNPFLPWCKDSQCCIGLNEACPAARKPWEVSLHKSLVVVRILKQVEMDGFVGNRQIQFLADGGSHVIKFTNQAMVASKWEVSMDS